MMSDEWGVSVMKDVVVAFVSFLVLVSIARGDEPRQDRSAVRKFDPGRFFGDHDDRLSRATPPDTLRLAEGFRAELLYTVPRAEQGSWVCLTSDPRGRFIASAQGGGLFRITPPPTGGAADATRVEPIDLDIGGAQGLLWAFDSLYAVVNDDDRSGLYRLRDTNGDDRLDAVACLRRFDDEGEHGPHAVVLGPSGRDLYIVGGNGCYLTEPPESSAIAAEWKEDRLQRRIGASDGTFGPDRPGGWVCRTDPEGKAFELVAMGFRNPYDLAFNPQGELFTFDSDMEWDAGTPWYRPTRVNHVLPGADYGWRAGTAKWPDDYLDSFGSVVEIGFSSPTGITFGTGAKFPERYQRALFLADWSYGNIYAVHLEPSGASYTGTFERFVSGAPLPVTDMMIGLNDGALYFTVGGRDTTSALYRVVYAGEQDTAPAAPVPDPGAEARALRRRLEAQPSLDLAWANLGHADRAVRHAARLAVERQPVAAWRERALTEPDPRARIAAVAALLRRGEATDRGAAVEVLGRIDWATLPDADRLDLLRAYELAATRFGPLDEPTRERVVRRLDPHFPANHARLDRELAEILTALDAPGIVARVLDQLERAGAQEEQLHYVMCLRDVPHGWTLEQRRRLLAWLAAGETRRGGVTFGEYLDQIRRDLIEPLSEEERTALADLLRERPQQPPDAELKRRAFVRKWTVDEALSRLGRDNEPGDPDRGRQVFAMALCYRCHRFAGQGGMVGPDLTGVAGRFNARDLLEAIVEPSRVVSDQYRTSRLAMKDGRVVTGKVKDISGNTMVVLPDALDVSNLLMVARDSVEEVAWSGASMMPEGLLDTFSEQEIADLLAFLRSAKDR